MMANYHQSRTDSGHVEAMREAMKAVEQLDFVTSAYVDDWGRFSNFSTFVAVKTKRKHDHRSWRRKEQVVLAEPLGLAKIKKQILQAIRERFPKAQLTFSADRRDGCYNLDVDFYQFDPESNSFPELVGA